MARARKFRRYLLTINDKQEEFTFEELQKLTEEYEVTRYFALSEERGEKEETRHFHIYLELEKPRAWTTIKKYYENFIPHIDYDLKGNSQHNRDYVMCEGTHEEKKKPHLIKAIEQGTMAQETMGERTDIDMVIEMLESGAKPREIRKAYPKAYLMHQRKIQSYWQDLIAEKYMLENRDIEVYYVSGPSGTGKTSGIYKKEGVENIYRVTNYDNPFDAYTTQDVIVLEEFHSQLQFGTLLQLTEEYPMYLKARYGDKVACFTKVYIVSNMEWDQQYTNLQYDKPRVFKAMDRRFTGFIKVNDFGDFEEYFENASLNSVEMAQKMFGAENVKVIEEKTNNIVLEDIV